MANVDGIRYTREALLERVGCMEQLCGVRAAALADGRAAGVRVADFWTGTGLEFTVLVDRGLDIGAARWQGKSLCWRSAVGDAHPAYYEPEGLGWLRTFGGGLLTTCGLTAAGAPDTDAGEELGLHGRVSHLPAESVHLDGGWEGDEYRVWASGKVRQTRVFGENLLLTRKISTHLGANSLWIHDVVHNEGHEPAPHMMLYHINLGFPVVDEGAELVAPSRRVTPRDPAAQAEGAEYHRFHAPRAGYQEKVYYHELTADERGWVPVALVNRRANKGAGLGVYVMYRQETLPHFVQWKMMGQGTYVVGVEPANCLVEGRAKERAEGRLQFLKPGEKREYQLEIGVLSCQEELDAFVERVSQARRRSG
ncbi:MAG: aldose 1-epimerase family protein [Armatimonadota bacterium]|nr:aldose 1-epimerase family protein [Armatimonadota bacterium]